MKYTLGLETSCDETSAAILAPDGITLLSNHVSSQVAAHSDYGGVVPELAGRLHAEIINDVIAEALKDAGVKLADIGLIAVTSGPGLSVSLVVGIAAAKALAWMTGAEIIGVNHLEGHITAVELAAGGEVEFPAICLLVSGGHTDIIHIVGRGCYTRLGGTVDDAAGEAFDKVARLLGLGYPGGPAIQQSAESGNPGTVRFPRPMIHEDSFDLSFSGLKTAVLNFIKTNEGDIGAPDSGAKYTASDVAASFQEAVVDVLCTKTIRAAKRKKVRSIWLAGGVAANRPLREELSMRADKAGFIFNVPPFILCTDNAAMVARAGFLKHSLGIEGLPLSPQPSIFL